MEALNPMLWRICHAKALPIILIIVSASNTQGRQKPFSTLLILSFTLATSTLVLRGTLVLVRRILNNGTLEVRQIREVIYWCANFAEKYLAAVSKKKTNSIMLWGESLANTTCLVVWSSQLRISACHLHKMTPKPLVTHQLIMDNEGAVPQCFH